MHTMWFIIFIYDMLTNYTNWIQTENMKTVTGWLGLTFAAVAAAGSGDTSAVDR